MPLPPASLITRQVRALFGNGTDVPAARRGALTGKSRPDPSRQIGRMSGAPSRAASAVRSSGCRCDSRSASTLFS